MSEEAFTQFEILKRWGAHPKLRLARVNTGVGWFNDLGPCRKTDDDARPVHFNPKGTADIVGIVEGGRMIMIEVKSADGVQSKDQIIMERVITKFGGAYCLARTVADVDAFFAGLGIIR